MCDYSSETTSSLYTLIFVTDAHLNVFRLVYFIMVVDVHLR